MSNSDMTVQSATNNCVVGINYILTDADGKILDQSEGQPLEYLHGHHNIIVGLEKAMEGHKVGDKFKVTIPAEEAYGQSDPDRIFEIDRSDLGSAGEPKVGMMARLSTDQGMIIARITEVSEEKVVFDANHPMAGIDLTFEVEVVSIRQATEEEIANGGLHNGCGGDCHSCGGCH
ncbi:MAG: peptidylprolyl isomerase [Candidatus Bruticola sp.]